LKKLVRQADKNGYLMDASVEDSERLCRVKQNDIRTEFLVLTRQLINNLESFAIQKHPLNHKPYLCCEDKSLQELFKEAAKFIVRYFFQGKTTLILRDENSGDNYEEEEEQEEPFVFAKAEEIYEIILQQTRKRIANKESNFKLKTKRKEDKLAKAKHQEGDGDSDEREIINNDSDNEQNIA
jgi:hypothetical protein